LVLVKPSGVTRGLVGEVISRIERRGLIIRVARMLMVTRDMAERHYAEHKGKDFYSDLVDHITSAPVFAMVSKVRRPFVSSA
jgi:nucleoside-diphosphate kinase